MRTARRSHLAEGRRGSVDENVTLTDGTGLAMSCQAQEKEDANPEEFLCKSVMNVNINIQHVLYS